MENIVVVIVGPTCSGKTDLSLLLAGSLNTELISADSRQIFKYLNIGTAKPTMDILSKYKHHFIDTLLPDEIFNVNIFEKEALEISNQLFINNKIPIAVGGSGLYIKALVDGIFDNVDVKEEVVVELQNRLKNEGREALYNELSIVDTVSAKKMLPSNWKRVVRALEVFYSTGKPIWYWQENYKRNDNIKFLQYGLNWNREILYNNIEKRVDVMIENGLVEEVKSILDMGYSSQLNSLNTVGYREIIDYFSNLYSLDRAIELIKRNTRRYAKRQMTWFNADSRIKWFDIKKTNDLEIIKDAIINEIKSMK